MRRPPAQKQWTNFFLVEWMEHRGVTQAELSKRTGLSEGFISQIVNGKLIGSPETLEKIAEALDIQLGMLFDVRPQAGYKLVRRLVLEREYDYAIHFFDFVLTKSRRLK